MYSLEKCPFCGEEAHLDYNYNGNWRYDTHFVFVKCNLCGAQSKTYSVKENPEKINWECQACIDAVNVWNRRVDG